MTELAPEVGAVTHRLIALLDQSLPGRLAGFYLVGSVAQDDYQSGRSDVEFVAVLSSAADPAALASVHADLAYAFPGLDCDGIYLLAGELSEPPAGAGMAVRAGRIDPASGDERHAAVWLILADDGIALWGRAPDHTWIAADRNAAIAYSRANLQSYWVQWLDKRRRLTSADGVSLLGNEGVVWGALGVARLHATIANGRVPSKTGGGAHALVAFPEHARLIGETLHLRGNPAATSTYRSPLTRRRDLIAFMDAVIGSAR